MFRIPSILAVAVLATFAAAGAATPEVENLPIVAARDEIVEGSVVHHSRGFQKHQRRSAAHHHQFHHLEERGSSLSVEITWYTKHDLLNPACLPGGGWNPTDSSQVIAVTQVWGAKPKCGSFWKLSSGGKSIVARVMDLCAGCEEGSSHFDLTKKVFTALADLDTGVVDGVKAVEVAPPSADEWDEDLFGPIELN